MNAFALTMIATLAASLPAGAAAACDVHSGPTAAALVELYTSEGCSSCPPADTYLNQLSTHLDASAKAIPIALHVGYWDGLGWADPYAQPKFAERQYWLVGLNGHRTAYTPHFFVNGRELQSWREDVTDSVRRLNRSPARADIHVRAVPAGGDALGIDVEAKTRDDGPDSLYLVVAENGLSSDVRHGENRGATLRHDHVVRLWSGPIPLHGAALATHRMFHLSPSWQRGRIEVIAFVQNDRTGAVLQAVRAGSCTVSGDGS